MIVQFPQAIPIKTIYFWIKIKASHPDLESRAGDSINYLQNPILDEIPSNFMGSWVVDCDATASFLHLSASSGWAWFEIYDYQVYSEKTLNGSVFEVTEPSGTWSNDPMSTVRNVDHFNNEIEFYDAGYDYPYDNFYDTVG